MSPASETRNLREEIPEDLEQLSRVKLQALAKTHGIKANKKNADIIAELRALAEEQHRPEEPVKVEQHGPEDPEQQENGATAWKYLFFIVELSTLIVTAVIAFCCKVTLSSVKMYLNSGNLATEVSADAKATGQTDLFSVKDPSNPDPDLAQVLKQEIEENHKLFGEVLEVNMDLAKGAYGQVKKACHLSTGREVVVKVIRPFNARDKVLKQAKEEMLIHQGLIHENVVRLYWGFEEESQYYMILELVPDKDLQDFLCTMKEQNIEEARTKRMFRQLIEGVAYLHEKGVVHRDLKPENIMVRKGPNNSVPVLKIADFGEAEKVGTDTSMIFRKGTPQTMAPEVSLMLPKGHAPSVHHMQTRSKKGIDEMKSDLWSLGMILHVMVVLEYPIFADVADVNDYISKLMEMAKKAMKEQADFPHLFEGDTQLWDGKKRRDHKYKWTDMDKVKELVKGLLKPVVADRWDLEKVKKCNWFDEKQNEGEVDSKEEVERGPMKKDGTPDKRYKANRR
jgi:serine/threonine protein kinase